MRQIKTHKSFDGQTSFWEHDSSETKTKMKFAAFTPATKPEGCLIFLSGLTCSEENFITKAGAQKYLAAANLMVVCPDTSPRGLALPGEHESWDFGSGAGFYVDATTPGYKDHYRMYSYVTGELYRLIQEQFAIPAGRISVMGHSMGGHGALIMALREPQKFKSVSAFSPIVNPMQCAWGEKALTGYLGEDRGVWAEYDATELIKKGRRHPQEIRIDQGDGDEFLEKQLLTPHFAEAAQKSGQAAAIQYRAGYDHSYYFISTFIEEHIRHHARLIQSVSI